MGFLQTMLLVKKEDLTFDQNYFTKIMDSIGKNLIRSHDQSKFQCLMKDVLL